MLKFLKRLAADESGVTAIEYAVLAAGVVVVVVAIFGDSGGFKEVLDKAFDNMKDAVPGGAEAPAAKS
ncbi:MAG: Flp family type IVb pilin [Pseudomonadota bacterium]